MVHGLHCLGWEGVSFHPCLVFAVMSGEGKLYSPAVGFTFHLHIFSKLQGYSGYGQSGDNSSYGQSYGNYHGNYGQNQTGLGILLHSLAVTKM